MGSDSDTNFVILLMVLIIGFVIFIRQKPKGTDIQQDIESEHNPDQIQEQENFDDGPVLIGPKKNRYRLCGDKYDKRDKRSAYKKYRKAMSHMRKKSEPEPQLNTEFITEQYHKDYNDTITAINNLTPQKELFNMGFLPVKIMQPSTHNVEELVRLFVRKVNDEVENRVAEYLNPNSGWNDQGKRKKTKSGFSTQMEELGLPGDLYTEPADKAQIQLIAIQGAEQQMTDDQIRFIVHIVVQKPNVADQMVLKVQFFMEKEDLKSGDLDAARNFFARSLVEQDPVNDIMKLDNTVIIEQVFTEGYLTNSGTAVTRMDKFYEYPDIMNANGIVDQYKVLQIMKAKHEERSAELSSFLCSVDDQTKELHDVPSIGDYQSYKNTRTIMDDLKINPQRSFGLVTV